MSYNWAFKYITTDIKLIFEIGSRDSLDAIELYNYFKSDIYAFECNPDGIKECINNLNNFTKIILIQKAVTNYDGIINFRPFIKDKYDNIGASSLFEIDFITNRDISDQDYGKTDVQDNIIVECTRLDTFINTHNKSPDLLCMDVQESELLVLLGLGDKISNIKYIIFEASSINTYKGGCTFNDIHNYLDQRTFKNVRLPRLMNFSTPVK